MKIRKLSAILLAGALMATPVVTSTVMAQTSQTDSTQSIVDESGNLVIEGTTITGLTEKGKAAKEIVIPEGVTEISSAYMGEFFRDCTNLESIKVSENNKNFTSIDGVLFGNDENFETGKKVLICYPANKAGKTYSVPENVGVISDYAFSNCANLEEVNISNNVEFITRISFIDCKKLKVLNIGSGLKGIEQTGMTATYFRGEIGLEAINVSEDNNSYSSVNGVLFNKDKTELIWFPACKNVESYVIPDTVKITHAFSFSDCKYLKNLTISDSVEKIYDREGDGFDGSLESITVSSKSQSFSTVDGVLFSKDKTCLHVYPAGKKDSSYYISNNVTEISDWAFMNNDSIKILYVPKSVTTIGIGAFNTKNNLTDIYYEGTETQWNKMEMTVLGGFFVPETTQIHFLATLPIETEDTDNNSSDTETSSDSEASSDSETSSDTSTTDSIDSETSSDNSNAESTDSETSIDSNSSNSGATSPDTGVAGLSLTLGVIALAGAAVVISRKKR